jgi:hypothetical protein
MKTETPLPSVRGLWQLLWRSIVFLPVAVLLTTLYLAFWCAIIALPLLTLFHACLREWEWAGLFVVIWLPLLFLTRWKRLHIDQKDLVNEHENV